MRRPAKGRKPRIASSKSYPTLVRGWIANEALSSPQPGGAAMMENGFPTATSVRMRGGSKLHATLGDGNSPVGSLFSYLTGSVVKFFGAIDTAIFEITTVADPLVSPSPAVSSLTGSNWSVVQFQTAGGVFLRLVNGQDDPLVFDGSAFVTTPAITGTGLDPKKLSFTWAYKKRLFYIEKGTMNAWYQDNVEALGGAASKFPLGSIFSRGGSLLFGASWSLDTGGGLSEQCIFGTTEGEIAVFEGDLPSNASQWNKVGVYRIGRPLGAKGSIRGGGDLIISTDIGFIPLSQAIQRDVAALAPAAVSYPIETEWNERVKMRSSAQWHAEVWPTKQMVLIALPSVNGSRPEMLVTNARTGAWGLYSGWDGTCLELFNERMFFGSTAGRVIEAEVGGLDVGLPGGPSRPYTMTLVPLFDGLKRPDLIKVAGTARAVIRAPGAVNGRLSCHADYQIELPPSPDAGPGRTGSLWDVGVWGSDTWGSQQMTVTIQDWESVSAEGYALAPGYQVTSGSIAPPDVEVIRIDLTYDVGDL